MAERYRVIYNGVEHKAKNVSDEYPEAEGVDFREMFELENGTRVSGEKLTEIEMIGWDLEDAVEDWIGGGAVNPQMEILDPSNQLGYEWARSVWDERFTLDEWAENVGLDVYVLENIVKKTQGYVDHGVKKAGEWYNIINEIDLPKNMYFQEFIGLIGNIWMDSDISFELDKLREADPDFDYESIRGYRTWGQKLYDIFPALGQEIKTVERVIGWGWADETSSKSNNNAIVFVGAGCLLIFFITK